MQPRTSTAWTRLHSVGLVYVLQAYLQVFGYSQLAKPYRAGEPHSIPPGSRLAARYPCGGTLWQTALYLATQPHLGYWDCLRMRGRDAWIALTALVHLLRLPALALLPPSLALAPWLLACTRLTAPLGMLTWLLLYGSQEEPTAIMLWYGRTWPLHDCAYAVMLLPTSLGLEALFGAIGVLISLAVGLYVNAVHPHLPYSCGHQLLLCVVCTAFTLCLQGCHDRAAQRAAQQRAAQRQRKGEGAAEGAWQAPAATQPAASSHPCDGPLLGGGSSNLASGSRAGPSGGPAPSPAEERGALWAALALQGPGHASCEAPEGIPPSGAASPPPVGRLITHGPPPGLARAAEEALQHELARALALDGHPIQGLSSCGDLMPRPGHPLALARDTPVLDPGRGLGFEGGLARGPGERLPYRPLVRMWRTYIKIDGVEPSDVAPGYKECIASVLEAAGMRLEGVSMRAGCVELVVDARSLEGAEEEEQGDERWGQQGPCEELLEAAGWAGTAAGGTAEGGRSAAGDDVSAEHALRHEPHAPKPRAQGGAAAASTQQETSRPASLQRLVLDVHEAAAAGPGPVPAAAPSAPASAQEPQPQAPVAPCSAPSTDEPGPGSGPRPGADATSSAGSFVTGRVGPTRPWDGDGGSRSRSPSRAGSSLSSGDGGSGGGLDIGALILALQLPEPQGEDEEEELGLEGSPSIGTSPVGPWAMTAEEAGAEAGEAPEAGTGEGTAASVRSQGSRSSVLAAAGSAAGSSREPSHSGSSDPGAMATSPAPAAPHFFATSSAAPSPSAGPRPRLLGAYPRVIAQSPPPPPLRPPPPQQLWHPPHALDDDTADVAPRSSDMAATSTTTATATAPATAAAEAGGADPAPPAASALARAPFTLQVVVWWPDPSPSPSPSQPQPQPPPHPPHPPPPPQPPQPPSQQQPPQPPPPRDRLDLVLRCRGVVLPAQLLAVAPVHVGKLPPPAPPRAGTHAPLPVPGSGLGTADAGVGAGTGPLPGALAAAPPAPGMAPGGVDPGLGGSWGYALRYTIQLPYLPVAPGLLLLEACGLQALPLALMGAHVDAADELQDAADCWPGSGEELDGLVTDLATFLAEAEAAAEAGAVLGAGVASLGLHLLAFARAQCWTALCDLLGSALHGASRSPSGPGPQPSAPLAVLHQARAPALVPAPLLLQLQPQRSFQACGRGVAPPSTGGSSAIGGCPDLTGGGAGGPAAELRRRFGGLRFRRLWRRADLPAGAFVDPRSIRDPLAPTPSHLELSGLCTEEEALKPAGVRKALAWSVSRLALCLVLTTVVAAVWWGGGFAGPRGLAAAAAAAVAVVAAAALVCSFCARGLRPRHACRTRGSANKA